MKFLTPLIFLSLALPALAQDLEAKWGETIAKFEAGDKEKAPPKDAILFVGSSSIRMWKLDVSWPDRVTINRGFGGSTTADLLHFFERIVTPYKPKAIVVYEGDNDVSKGLSADEVFADYQKLIAKIDEQLPGTPLIFIAIKPSIKRWKMWPVMNDANQQIAKFSETRDTLYFADIGKAMLATESGQLDPSHFKEDGLHLTADGYKIWKSVIEPILETALK
ncbi:MAG: lysophospholipase L1-like esterase [Verrucomicrobiales bacterium]|jgi:lysophospholipase L1-like esterase